MDFLAPAPAEPAAPRPLSVEPGQRQSIKELLLPMFLKVGSSAQNLRADSAGFWRDGDDRYWMPRIVFRGAGETGEPYLRIAIFAGIHGDEPAGIQAVMDLLDFMEANTFLFRAYRIHVYPLCNPTGYEDGTRHSRSGKDLNREFWQNSPEPEVRILERELATHKFDGLIALHSDDTSHGVYGFVRGHELAELLLRPALAAAEAELPVNRDPLIDGFHAVEGLIHTCYDGILCAPCEQSPKPFELILETPTHADLALQRKAFVLAVTETLRQYRRLASFAQDI